MVSKSPTPFIPAGTVVNASHPDIKYYITLTPEQLRQRWLEPEGQEIYKVWKEGGFNRDALAAVVGQLYENLDGRGAPLSDEDASGANLSAIDMFAADCQRAKFVGTNLTGSFLSEADIRGADFSWARMNSALLDNANYDGTTKFLGVNLNAVNFNLAALLQEQALTQQRIAHLEQRYPLLAFFLHWTCDYGRSLGLWSAWVVAVLLFFGILFANVSGATNHTGLADNMYFSVVTFTTLGYGDVLPVSVFGKVLAVIEVVIGYVMGGLLIAILTRKVLGS